MKLCQLSVFLENKAGRLSEPCKILSENKINILTLSLADTQQFGILRLILKEWEQAQKVLQQAGFVVHVNEVVAVEVDDRPGGLAYLLEGLERQQINIEYMYAFTFRSGDKALIVFRFENADQAIKVLQDQGVNPVSSVELYEKAGQ